MSTDAYSVPGPKGDGDVGGLAGGAVPGPDGVPGPKGVGTSGTVGGIVPVGLCTTMVGPAFLAFAAEAVTNDAANSADTAITLVKFIVFLPQ